MSEVIKTRKCSKCKKAKELTKENFHISKNPSGFNYYCMICSNAVRKKKLDQSEEIPPTQAIKIQALKNSLPFLFNKTKSKFERKLKFYEPK